jgi:hypothetical protein
MKMTMSYYCSDCFIYVITRWSVMSKKYSVFWEVTPCGSCKNRRIVSIIRVARIGELGTTLAVISNRRTP